jgi:hypothetical protein
MGSGHHFSRVSHAAGAGRRDARGTRLFGARLVQRGRGGGGEPLSKWGRFPMARPRVLGDAGSNRKEREMKRPIICAGKGVRICGGALDR